MSRLRDGVEAVVETIGGLLFVLGTVAVVALPWLLVLLLVGGDVDAAEGTIGVALTVVFMVGVVGALLGRD